MLMLLVWEQHFESHCLGVCLILETKEVDVEKSGGNIWELFVKSLHA